MLFILNLFITASSKAISLTDGNYEILKDPNTKPLIIELWDLKCKTICQNIESTIEDVIKKEYSENIVFAEINCVENSNLCSSLTNKNTYPQIVWFDSDTKQKFLYQGNEYTREKLKNFIKYQLSFPFIFIKDKNKITNIKNEEIKNSVFIFYYKDTNDDKFKIAKNAAKSIAQNNQCQFYAIEDKRFKLSAIREKDSESFYHGDWLQNSLYLFIKRRLFPTLVEFNRKTIDQLKSSHRLTLIAFLDPKIYLSDWKHLAQEIESDFQFSYVIYSPRNSFARLFGIQATNLPQVILYDANNQKWIPYENDLTDTGLIKWMKQLDLTNANWKTPQNAFLRILELGFISLLSNGGPIFYLFLLILFFVIALIIRFINGTLFKKPRHKRGSDRAYEAL